MYSRAKGLWFISVVTLLGCETVTGNSSGAGGGGGTIAIESLPAALTSTMCGAISKCGSWSTHFASTAGCAAMLGSEFSTDDEIADVKAGKLAYDATKAGQCLAVMGSMCVGDLDEEPAACTDVFSGVLADGAVCEQNKYCKSKYCKREAGKECGVCALAAKAGEKCDANGEGCMSNHACIDGTCIANGTVAAGAQCNSDKNCLPDHDCNWNVNPSVCKARGAKDAVCKNNQDCVKGLVCVMATFGANEGKCGTAAAANQSCNKIGGQESESCATGSSCCVPTTWDGKSMPEAKCLPLLKLGEACTSHMQCGLDGECKDGKCALLPAKVGDACAAAVIPGTQKRCAFGLQCGTGDKCAALSKVGEACKSKSQCEKGLDCNDAEKCYTQSGPGGACDDQKGEYCADGLQCGADGKCVAPAVCK